MEYQEMVFKKEMVWAQVRSHQSPLTHVIRTDILSIIETLIQLFIQTNTPTKDESRLLRGD